MRDEDFDKLGAPRQSDGEVANERARVPGKQTLVEAEQNRSVRTVGVPGKRTLAQGLDAWGQGVAETRDPVTETELHVRKAREIIAKLALRPPPTEYKLLRADLAVHVESAKAVAPAAISRPNGREVAASVFDLMGEAQPYLQKPGTSSGANADPAVVAQRGLEASSVPLPHRDVLQRSFGAHDLAGIEAHIGGAAAEASSELAAHAYAYGNHVAFAKDPEAPTVAHEVTHVLQQRAGVSLKSIDGGASDPHEQQADAVAGAVARGESAEALLSPIAGTGGGATSHAVQRKSDGASPAMGPSGPEKRPGLDEKDYQGPLTATAYFAYNEAKFLEAVRARLATTLLPVPHERLVWTAGSITVAAAFPVALHDEAGTGMNLALRLPELLYPTDPWQLIDLHRDVSSGRVGDTVAGAMATGSKEWNNVAGMALAVEIEAALRRSLPRMGLRYVAQADDYAGAVPPELLVASHPFDRVVAKLLCDPSVARFIGSKKAHDKSDTHQPGAFKDGLRLVNVEWQGGHDLKLWNWVRATPANATAEEVAASIFERRDGKNHTEYAYALVSSPPFFRVPPKWARELPGAKEHAPASTATNESADANSALDLADSANVDEAARQQAGAPAAKIDIHALQVALDRSKAQLELASARLATWKLGYLVGPALRWVDKHRDAVLATPTDTLRAWASIVAAQSTTLSDALGDLIEVLDVAMSAHVQPGTPEAKPFQDVIEAFAIAMGESQLAQAAAPQLAAAKRMKAALPLTLLDRSMLETRQTAHELADVGAPKEVVSTAQQTSDSLEAGAVETRAKLMAGGDLNATDLEAITVAASEQALRTRVWTLRTKLEQLQAAVYAQTDGAVGAGVNTGKMRPLKNKLAELEPAVWNILETMQKEALPTGPLPADNAQAQRMFAETRKAAVARAQTAFARLHEDYKLDAFFHEALDTISEAERRTAYVTLAIEIAVLLGVSIVGGVVGNAVGGVVRSAVLADAATDTLAFARTATAARWAGAAANVATDAAVNAAGQTAIFGGSTKLSFVENAMTNLMTLGALRPFHGLAGDLGKLDREAQGLWKVVTRSKVVLVETGTLTMETLVAAGASYVAARLVEGQSPPDNDTAVAWAMQGASMAVGKFVHGKLQDLTSRWSHVPEEKVHFLKRARAQEHLAKTVESTGSTEAALQLLEEHVKILEDERALLHDDKALAKLGLDARQVDTLRAGNDAALAETSTQAYEVMKLRFLGLEPLADNGLVWSGTRDQIDAALAEAGGSVKNVEPAGENRRTAYIAGRHVTFVEIGSATRPLRASAARAEVRQRELTRDRIPAHLREQQAKGATVADAGRDEVTGRRRYEVTFPDGKREVVVEKGVDASRPGAGGTPPQEHEASANRRAADRVAEIQSKRNAELAARIEEQGAKPIVVDTGIAGAGQAGTLAAATTRDASAAVPGVEIKSIPPVINFAPEGSMFANHGDFPIGQGHDDLHGPEHIRHAGEFSSDRTGYARASDYVRSLTMTGYEAGMVTYPAKVDEVDVRPPGGWGPDVDPSIADMPLRWTAGGHTFYGKRFITAGGLGRPRSLGRPNTPLSAHEPALREARKLVDAQRTLVLPDGSAGKVVVVVGSGATGAWACEAAIQAGASKIYWAGIMGPHVEDAALRADLAAFGLDAAQIDTFARAYNKRNAGVFKLIEQGRIELRAQTIADAVLNEKTGRVAVTFPGSQAATEVDGIVSAVGQELDLPKGIDQAHVVFRMVRPGGRLVALDAFDPKDNRRLGIRMVGAQLAKAEPLVAQDELMEFKRLLDEQVNAPSVPSNARGVPGSIYQTNIDVPLASREAPLEPGEVK